MAIITTIGLDLAKRYFQVHGVDKQGKVVLKKKLSREGVLSFFVNLPPCLVGVEACGGLALLNQGDREVRSHGQADNSPLKKSVI